MDAQSVLESVMQVGQEWVAPILFGMDASDGEADIKLLRNAEHAALLEARVKLCGADG